MPSPTPEPNSPPLPVAEPMNPPPRVYNAIYSAVQVYECMIRGIAVMRRRVDSYVNATQILKVAGIDKGRRTKILEKEILPGKHEIVQGGYGKYQGTWIPLERGRDVAIQFGVGALLSPLFDYIPANSGMPHHRLPPLPNATRVPSYYPGPGQIHPGMSFGSSQSLPPYNNTSGPSSSTPGGRASPFVNPQSSFNPSGTSSPVHTASKTNLGRVSSNGQAHAYLHPSGSFNGKQPARTIATHQAAKRARESGSLAGSPGLKSNGINGDMVIGPDGKPSPAKRPRLGDGPPFLHDDGGPSASPLDFLLDGSGAPRRVILPKFQRYRAIIAAITHDSEPSTILEYLQQGAEDNVSTIAEPTTDYLNVAVDDQGHTALHWAAALGRTPTVEALVLAGADVSKGNDAGETPLIRSVLSLSPFHAQSFNLLLEHLAPSIRAVDLSSRTALHHTALVAGVKGRAPSARYYLESMLEFLARTDGEISVKSLVDIQDIHGDTALNLAARIGNRSLVRSLVDVGASKVIPNRLGLKPLDFGVFDDGYTDYDDAFATKVDMKESSPILSREQNTADAVADAKSIIESLGADLAASVKAKQDSLDTTRLELLSAACELADSRREIVAAQAITAEADTLKQKVDNLEHAVQEEEGFDWGVPGWQTGRGRGHPGTASEDNATSAPTVFPGATSYYTPVSEPIPLDAVMDQSGWDPEPEVPMVDSLASLVLLRRLNDWHTRVDKVLDARLRILEGKDAEKEFQCRKVISLCTGVPVDKIDSILGQLITALDSDGVIPEVQKVAEFMSRVGEVTPPPLA